MSFPSHFLYCCSSFISLVINKTLWPEWKYSLSECLCPRDLSRWCVWSSDISTIYFTFYCLFAFILKIFFLFIEEKMSMHIWGTSLFSNFFFIGSPLAVSLCKSQLPFIPSSPSATVRLPVCVCRTSKTNWHTFAAKCSVLTCTCSSDYQLACVVYSSGWWDADEPKAGADIFLPCGLGRGGRCVCVCVCVLGGWGVQVSVQV